MRVKQFQTDEDERYIVLLFKTDKFKGTLTSSDEDERYIVLLFKTDKFKGTLTSSDEGEMKWIDRDSLQDYILVNDFMDLLKVFDSDCYSEFMYERSNSDDDWLIRLY